MFFMNITATALSDTTYQQRMSSKSKLAMSALAAAIVTALPLASPAQIIPAAQYSGTVIVGADDGYNTWLVSGPGSYSHTATGSYGGSATSSLNISTQPNPSVSLTSSVSGPAMNGVIADTNTYGNFPGLDGNLLLYSVEFLGPAGLVPIQVNAKLGASLSPIAPGAFGNEITEAYFGVGGVSSGYEFFDGIYINGSYGITSDSAGNVNYLSYNPSSGISGSTAYSHVWEAQTNTVYTVSLGLYEALDLSGDLGGGSMTVSAYADPTFQISSLAVDPSLYSVIVSKGIGNSVSAVPEPQTLATILAGLLQIVFIVSLANKIKLKKISRLLVLSLKLRNQCGELT